MTPVLFRQCQHTMPLHAMEGLAYQGADAVVNLGVGCHGDGGGDKQAGVNETVDCCELAAKGRGSVGHEL